MLKRFKSAVSALQHGCKTCEGFHSDIAGSSMSMMRRILAHEDVDVSRIEVMAVCWTWKSLPQIRYKRPLEFHNSSLYCSLYSALSTCTLLIPSLHYHKQVTCHSALFVCIQIHYVREDQPRYSHCLYGISSNSHISCEYPLACYISLSSWAWHVQPCKAR